MAEAERGVTTGPASDQAPRIATSGVQLGRRVESRTFVQQSWQRFRRNRLAVVSLVVMIVIIAMGFGAPLISHYVTHHSYEEQSLLDRFKKPGQDGYLLGT